MSKTYKDRLIEKAESLGWTVNTYSNGTEWNFGKYSPAGEDFSFDVCERDGTVPEEVRRYAAYFDADEHAEMWVGFRGKRGVPETIREIVDDADAIQEMLDELADALAEVGEEES